MLNRYNNLFFVPKSVSIVFRIWCPGCLIINLFTDLTINENAFLIAFGAMIMFLLLIVESLTESI